MKTLDDKIEEVKKFVERYSEQKTKYEGPYYSIVFQQDGEIKTHKTNATHHGCFSVLGVMSRQDIFNGLIDHFKLYPGNQ